MRAKSGIRVLASVLLLQTIVVASCGKDSPTDASHELIAELAAAPPFVLQGDEVIIQITIRNDTGKEIQTDYGCCWTFQMYTSDMQELNMQWLCPAVTCPERSLMPGEQMSFSHRFSTVVPTYYATNWPSEDGKLAAGKYFVRSGLGDLRDDSNAGPWVQGEFWVVKVK
jgi:hypothetical protein